MRDPLVERLRAAGCADAEAEAVEVRRVLGTGAHDDLVAARAQGEPLQHLLGTAVVGMSGEGAAAVEVQVDPGVFVPRQRTAALAGRAVERASARPGAVVVDLGCGSGVLAAAVAGRVPTAQVHACDVDERAAACARRNASRLGFAVHQGSWWEALPDALRGRVEVAVTYLPHVPDAELALLPRDVLAHEPVAAFAGGSDGLSPLRTVLADLAQWLAPTGVLVTLLSSEQAEEAVRLARELGWRAEACPVDSEDAIVEVFQRSL